MSSPAQETICRFLEWDTNFFGCKVGRVVPTQLTPELMPAILNWCQARQIDCLYLLADSNHDATLRLATEHGFRLADIRVTFERRQLGAPEDSSHREPRLRSFRDQDLPALRALAGRLHQDTRFFVDENFPRPQCRQLYELWIERSCRDPQGQVLVMEGAGGLAGYIACSINENRKGRIELIGVEAGAQGQGAGRALVMESLKWFAAKQVESVTVVTQGRNIPAQRLYQKCGFLTQQLQLWFHRWSARRMV